MTKSTLTQCFTLDFWLSCNKAVILSLICNKQFFFEFLIIKKTNANYLNNQIFS